MVKLGDEWKDLKNYIIFRHKHLLIERQAIPYTIQDKKKRYNVFRVLKGRLDELNHLKKIVNEDIKEASKYEYSKAKYLEEKKIKYIKQRQKNGSNVRLEL